MTGPCRSPSGHARDSYFLASRRFSIGSTPGALSVVNLSEQELVAYATLRDVDHARRYGLIAPLGRGEAAVLAVAEARGWNLATDDQDAINVAQQLIPTGSRGASGRCSGEQLTRV